MDGAAQVSNSPRAKLVVQQCLSAKLQVKPPAQEEEPEFVEIGRGIVMYVCFLKGADEDTVDKMVKFVTNIRLSESGSESKLVSILDLPGDILIVPQATLGGKAKGKVMQYHANIPKDRGKQLYQQFVELCQSSLTGSTQAVEADCKVRHGTFGNRQVLSIVTNGPYTHTVDY